MHDSYETENYDPKELEWLAKGLIVVLVLVLGLLAIFVGIWISNILVNTEDGIEPETSKIIISNNEAACPIVSKKSYYQVSEEERYLLAKLAHAEGSICSQECQQDIVSVVFNRLESGRWRKDVNNDGQITLYDIIYYPNAFTPATNGAIDKWEPTSKDYTAVDYVIENGPTVPTYVRYFRASYDFSWDGYKNYKITDNVYFGYFTDWQKGAW